MSREDQERFEDYQELERYIEELQAGHIAHPPRELTPTQSHLYWMAALFRSASLEEGQPRPEFVTELQARLEQERGWMEGRVGETLQGRTGEAQQPPKTQPFTSPPKQAQEKCHGVSRRTLLTSGAAVAASLIIGAGIERAVEEGITDSRDSVYPPLVPPGIPTTWHFVTTLAAFGERAVRFATDTIVGYVIRDDGDGDDLDNRKIIAMSATCTHMGCIVQWRDADRKFHCPCHGSLFSAYGKIDKNSGLVRYLTPLPRLETKVEDGRVYVKVPDTRGEQHGSTTGQRRW